MGLLTEDDNVFVPGDVPSASGGSRARPWYFRTATVLVGFLCVGPLVLPLVALNPFYRLRVKVLGTLAIILVTVALSVGVAAAVRSIIIYYRLMFTFP